MSRAPRDPATAFLRGAFEGWLDGRQPYEELHLCDEGSAVTLAGHQVRVELVGPIAGEDVPVETVVRTVSKMGAAPRKAGRRAVKALRDQMTHDQMTQGERAAESDFYDGPESGTEATGDW